MKVPGPIAKPAASVIPGRITVFILPMYNNNVKMMIAIPEIMFFFRLFLQFSIVKAKKLKANSKKVGL